MILGQMLGSPQETIDFYKNDNGKMDDVQMAHIRQHVTGPSLTSITNKGYERLRHNISEQFSREGDDCMDIPDLFAFVQDHVTIALTKTLLGTDISNRYPQMTTDQWIFMDRSIEIVMGLPRSIISGAYDARDRLLANLKSWNTQSSALRKAGKADLVWDAKAGSNLLQERQERYEKTPGFNEDAQVSQVLGLLFASNGLTPPVTFWYVFETLRDPAILEKVSAEVGNYFDVTTNAYDFAQLAAQPILQSLHAEATRLYASNVTQRVLTAPTFALDDKYSITQGTTLFIYTKMTALYNPGWTEARPHATSRPLDTIWAERFLTSDKGKTPRYNEAGLVGSFTSFGGGEYWCPGRQSARNVGIVTLAVLLGDFECELVDRDTVKYGVPVLNETAFEKVEPTRKVAARLRRRQR